MSILGEHYFKTSNAIYSYSLGCRELAVYGYLRSRAGSRDTCWPSMQTIAAACSCSDTTARKAVDELERRKFIRPQCGRFRGRGLTLFCGLTSLIDADF